MNFEFDTENTIIGTVFSHAGDELLTLSLRDRLKHFLAIGKSGRGKTTLLANMAIQDIHAGRGVAVIDPHGDLARDLLNHIPSWRAADLIYLDPADPDRVVTFNVVQSGPPERIAATASALVGAFKALWSDSWGPRLERVLYNAIAALIEAPNTSLIGLPKLLKSPPYRRRVLAQVHDPMVRDFFDSEFEAWRDDYRMQVLDPVLNKIEMVLGSPIVRASLGTVTSSIDFGEIMDTRKILIANLGKGILGPGHARLLGAMLVSGFANAAMARGAVDAIEVPRVPFFLVVDEFQNFSSENFGEILSELRKQALSLTIGHQYLEQVPTTLRAAVLGNVGSIAAFELSAADAEVMAAELGLKSSEPLTAQGEGEAWFKHARYGGPYHPRLLPPIATNAKGRAAALKQSRLRYTYPRARVDQTLQRFFHSATS